MSSAKYLKSLGPISPYPDKIGILATKPAEVVRKHHRSSDAVGIQVRSERSGDPDFVGILGTSKIPLSAGFFKIEILSSKFASPDKPGSSIGESAFRRDPI